MDLIALDHRLFKAINSLAGVYGWLDVFFIFAAEYIVFLMVAGLVLFVFQKSGSLNGRGPGKRDGFGNKELMMVAEPLAAGFFAREVFGEIIRFLVPRARPFVSYVVIQLIAHNAAEPSFPSGHALFMFGLATSLFMVDKKWGSVYLVLAAVSSFARVAVGVHYPADVVVGALLGVLSAILTRACAHKIFADGRDRF